MVEHNARIATKLNPWTAWTTVADAPLRGLALAREAGRILAWDEANELYLFSAQGEMLSTIRAAHRITTAAISDDGSLIALLTENGQPELHLLTSDFETQVVRPAPTEAALLSLDPHGRYVAVGSRLSTVHMISKYGRTCGRIDTIQPLAHLCFVANRAFLVGAAAFGMLIGIELSWTRDGTRMVPDLSWQDRLMSNVGRLGVSGDGGMILTSCYTHGIQRFDLQGRNEGSYHLGGTVSHAVPDFPGRTIAAATLEGELAILNSAGNVRWRTRLTRPVIAIEMDALGRFVVFGHSTGEILRLELFSSDSESHGPPPALARSVTSEGPAVRTSSGAIRQPDWSIPVVKSDDQAETAVIAISEDPVRIGLFTSPHRFQLYSREGRLLGEGPPMVGVGRILRTAPGWLAAATDRQVVLYDLRRNTKQRLDASLAELTHLAIQPDDYGLALVQERDRVGRITPSGRWVWKKELRSPVEDLAIGSEGSTAVTTTDGELIVFDPGGNPEIRAMFDPSDPPLIIPGRPTLAMGAAWITLSRRQQQLCGHDLHGNPLWNRPLPWEGWSLSQIGDLILIASAEGAVHAIDVAGTLRHEGPPSGLSSDQFAVDTQGRPLRISRRSVHLICSFLDGRVRWRAIGEQPLGPYAAGAAGVAIMIGRSLAWFSLEGSARPTNETNP
jgi:hypothetical protein